MIVLTTKPTTDVIKLTRNTTPPLISCLGSFQDEPGRNLVLFTGGGQPRGTNRGTVVKLGRWS